MKIAIAGKGGVGKTTLSGLLARALAGAGWRVLAIDADPDANLASALGIAPARMRAVEPISHMTALARARTGAAATGGAHFILNPKVEDLPEEFAVRHEGVSLLLMGRVDHAGAGCVCPEHALVKTLVKHILTGRDECVLMDMEAGLEHLGRGTVAAVDILLAVVEPGLRSLQTAGQIVTLARELGVRRIGVVASKVKGPEDEAFIRERLDGMALLGILAQDDDIARADREGLSAYDVAPRARAAAEALLGEIGRFVNGQEEQRQCV